MKRRMARGFTLVEVLVALMVIALGLAALMTAVSSTARSSGYLRDKTLAQWIALNRLTEVRLNMSKFYKNSDTGELDFANRKWHYDTRYFDTSIATMKRVVVRVWPGDAKAKGNPLAEFSTFLGTALNVPGSSNNADWTTGSTVATSTTTPGVITTPGVTATPGVTTTPATPLTPTVTGPMPAQ